MATTAAAAAAAAASVTVSGTTRWCPTPEQLMILEEMYRGGLRTPNSSQIQQITAHLAHYGRIEGKNVFYWFQNHKARDRQKLRRRLCMSHHLLSCAHYYAAANAGHHHLLGAAAGAVAPMQQQHHHQQYYSASCAGGGFDQHLLPATVASPTAAAAYAAAGYGYPAFAAATPQTTSRCAAGVNQPSPQTTPLSTSFGYQGGAGGGGGSPEYSLGRLGSFGVVVEEDTCRSSRYEQQPLFVQTEESSAPATGMSFCRPLKTLDLFPGAIKEEQRDVA